MLAPIPSAPTPANRSQTLGTTPNVSHGILMVMTAVIFFSVGDLMAKYLTRFYPIPLIVWARFACHLLLVVILLGPRYGSRLVKTARPLTQLLRGTLLLAGSVFFVSALRDHAARRARRLSPISRRYWLP